MAGLILYPGEVEKQCNDMINALETNKSSLSAVEANIEEFVTNESLEGASWDAMKRQIGNHQYAIRAIILAEDAIIEDSRKLSSGLGTDILIEDDLKSCIENLKQANEALGESNVQYLQMLSMAPGLPSDTAMILQRNIHENQLLIEENLFMISHRQLQLAALYETEAATSNCFSEAADLLNQANGIIEGLGKAWNGKTGKFSPVKLTDSQIHNINKSWTKTYIRDVKKEGINLTESRAKMLMELGYTPEKISCMMASCEYDSDRKFLRDMLTGNYDSAFKICPYRVCADKGRKDETGLSDSMKIYLAEFATGLYAEAEQRSHTKEKNPFAELLKFTNAIYTKTYVGRSEGWVHQSVSYATTYLKYLYVGSDANVISRSTYLRSREVTPRQFEKIATKQYQYMIMEGYWAAQMEKYQSNPRHFEYVEIDNFSTDSLNHSISFDMTGSWIHRQYIKKSQKYSLGAEVLEIPSDMIDAHYDESMGELEKESNDLLRKCVCDGVTNATLAFLSATIPELGYPLIAAKALFDRQEAKAVENSYYDIKEIRKPDKKTEKIWDAQAKPFIAGLSAMEDYYNRKGGIDQEKNVLNMKYIDEQFGSGIRINTGDSKKIIRRGIIDPKEAYLWGKWEREGLSAYTEIETKDYDAIEKQIDKLTENPQSGVTDETANNMKLLLRGGEVGDLAMMPTDKLCYAHEKLNTEILRKLDEGRFGKRYSISGAYSEELNKEVP
ncbi:MAG: LXG domain-containing protein [Eubacterium sp.]|nr:LXG domain-containing protein [Eubacterium sp.]